MPSATLAAQEFAASIVHLDARAASAVASTTATHAAAILARDPASAPDVAAARWAAAASSAGAHAAGSLKPGARLLCVGGGLSVRAAAAAVGEDGGRCVIVGDVDVKGYGRDVCVCDFSGVGSVLAEVDAVCFGVDFVLGDGSCVVAQGVACVVAMAKEDKVRCMGVAAKAKFSGEVVLEGVGRKGLEVLFAVEEFWTENGKVDAESASVEF